MQVKAQWHILIEEEEAEPSRTPPLSLQDPHLQDYEEEVASVLGSMGRFMKVENN